MLILRFAVSFVIVSNSVNSLAPQSGRDNCHITNITLRRVILLRELKRKKQKKELKNVSKLRKQFHLVRIRETMIAIIIGVLFLLDDHN